MPPQNGEYMIAAYVAAGLFYGGYLLLLWRRHAALASRERALGLTDGAADAADRSR